MAYDYDKLYQSKKNALGSINSDVKYFFDWLDDRSLDVLDIGCGQGRDALPIAALGHAVTGVDISSAGIDDLLKNGKNLKISGIVANILDYTPQKAYDILLIDRTLHMLSETDRNRCFSRLLNSVKKGGYLLLIDAPKNMAGFRDNLSPKEWMQIKRNKSVEFSRRRIT